MRAVTIPRADRPLVSVVMVTYGGGEWAERALSALAERTEPIYEAIVVDNASPDGTGNRLRERVTGATLLLNGRNVGFGPAANQGAAHALGRYVCFLNPDALVEPGWLPPLVEALESDPAAAAAAPRLLNLDGTLQEAGSLVGGDGTTWALGHDEDANDVSHRSRTRVDYGSAACLLVRRSAFLGVGGFDPAYVPAYCEDVDLCLALAERGLHVVRVPVSEVRHARAASTDVSAAGGLILRNRRLLHERWWRRLADRPPLQDAEVYPHRVLAARDRDRPDRILVIAARVQDVGGLVFEIARRWPSASVTLLVADGRDAARTGAPLLDAGIEVVPGPRDWDEWFERRRFHYGAVLVDGDAATGFGDPLRRTQPQASRRQLPDGPEELVSTLAALGVAPPPSPRVA